MKKTITSMMLMGLFGLHEGIAQTDYTAGRNEAATELLSQQPVKKILTDNRILVRKSPNLMRNLGNPARLHSTRATQKQYVLSEDFSLFTAGSEETPDLSSIFDPDGFILNEYTHQPYWFGESVYQAGGKAFIGMSEYEPGLTGYLATPDIDLSGNKGAFIVRFKAKATNQQEDGFYVVSTDLYNEEESVYYGICNLTQEWQDFEVPLSGGCPTSSIQMYSNSAEMLIDDITIENKGLPAPIATGCTEFDGASFTATWTAVEGATSYLFEVFELTPYGDQKTTLGPVELTETSYSVSGLDPNVNHYYIVKAKNDQYTSCNSKEMLAKLSVLDTPQVEEITDVTANSFTAKWTPVENAIAYMPYISVKHTAKKAEDYPILNTDFSKIDVTNTVDDPKFVVSQYMDDWMDRADWIVNSPVLANGILGIAQGNILSPVFDFSNGNKTVTVTSNMMGREGVTHATISLRRDNPDGIEILSQQDVELTDQFQPVTVNLPNGGSDCYIRIESTEEGYLFLDDLKVSANMQADDLIYVPICSYDMQETSYTFVDYPRIKDEQIAFAVLAYAFNEIDYTYLMSPLSEYVEIPVQTGIIGHTTDAVTVRATGNTIQITAPKHSSVKVYNANGQLIQQKNMSETTTSIQLPQVGVYLVKVGDRTYKVTF